METPIMQPESNSLTHEEEEEVKHDVSILRNQLQQFSLAQNVIENKMDGLKKDIEAKIDGLKKGVEAKMNELEAKMDDVETKMDGMEAEMNCMDATMNGMDDNMEELKINLNKLLQEMVTNGER